MSTKLKVAALALLVGANLALFSPEIAHAQTTEFNNVCTDWQRQHGGCDIGLRALVLKMINWALLFVGLIATAILIYGGFLYVTSAGNDENVGKAKKLILYAAIGIVVIILSAVIVNSVLGIATTTSATQQ